MTILEAPLAGKHREGIRFKFQNNKLASPHQILSHAGGATVWPYLGVSIFPEKGSAVFWYNTREDAQPDPLSLHSACPVLLGQKWSK